MMKHLTVAEKHPYAIGLKGVIIGEGDTREEAIIDLESAIKFHIKTFGERNETI